MKQTIQGEAPFQILASNFSISPSQEDYTLQISANGTDFSDLFVVSAGQTKMVTNVANGSYYRLKDNESTVTINWRTQCDDGQGGGGGGQGPQGPMGPAGPQGPQGPAGGGSSADTQALIDANNQLIEDGEIVAGMAKQLYSPDGVESSNDFNYRTTAGDEDVTTGPAKLNYVEAGETIYPEEDPISVTLVRNDSPVAIDYEIMGTKNIPFGTTTFIFDTEMGGWSPADILDDVYITINGNEYQPSNFDEITTVRTMAKQGDAQFAAPIAFVALGLNSFNKDVADNIINFVVAEGKRFSVGYEDPDDYSLVADNDYNIYAIKAVPNLETGYVVFHNDDDSSVSWAGIADGLDLNDNEFIFSDTDREGNYDVVYPSDTHPYIVFSLRTDDTGTVCVHPQWSGYKNEQYEDYTENRIELQDSITGNYFKDMLPLYGGNGGYNRWNLAEQKLQQFIETMPYTAQDVEDLINDGKVPGEDFNYDETTIYVKSDTVISEIPIEIDYGYTADDFSVEYFIALDENDDEIISPLTVYAETWYMNNLVDKLRRMENNFIHLNDLKSDGETGKTYECNGRLFKWVDGAGQWGEWIFPTNTGNFDYTGYEEIGLLKYSYLPDGELCVTYYYNTAQTYVVYDSNEDLIMVYTDAAHNNLYRAIGKNEGEVQLSDASRKVYLTWTEGLLRFRMQTSVNVKNRLSTTVYEPHYEVFVENWATKMEHNYITDSGIPIWNKEGVIIGRMAQYSTKNLYFNTTTTGSGSRLGVVTNGNNGGPERIWVPTTGGAAGQILQSNGDNAAPTWTNWIKSVKMTSAEYEALATKDPNTLYLIVD